MAAPMAEPIVHRYAPRGTCRELFDGPAARAGELVVSGPAGTGKSMACLEKIHRMCLLTPGLRALVLRKTLVSLTSTGLVTYQEKVATEALAARDVVWFGGSQREPPAYRYSNGSAMVVGGMDNPTKVMSSDYDVVYAQECTELLEDEWEKLTTRLRHGAIRFQQLLGDCNPDTPTHWLLNRANKGLTTMLHSRHEDNPMLFDEIHGPDGRVRHVITERGADYIGKLDRLTGVRYQRLRKGLWVAAEGLIYEAYDPAVHLVDRFPIPSTWTRWWAVDFGFTNPFVCQCWAEDPDGRLWLEWEVYHTRRLVEDHAVTILDQVSHPDPDYVHPAGRPRYVHHGRIWTGPKPRAILCDHDAEDRATLERHVGLSTTAATKTVNDGIQAVEARFKPAGDGKPRLMLLRDAVVERDPELESVKKPQCTAEEIPGYIWEPPKPGKPPKETPLKENDHGADAMRYVVAARDLRGRPGIRWL